MDARISNLVEEIPEKPPRSKLEVHAEVIFALRRKRRTYREIAQFFGEHLSIPVAPSTIHDFVRIRRRMAKRLGAASREHPANHPPTTQNSVHQKIADLKRRAAPEEPKPLFTYEEDEPLKLRRKPD